MLMNYFNTVRISLHSFHRKGAVLSLELTTEYLGHPMNCADSKF